MYDMTSDYKSHMYKPRPGIGPTLGNKGDQEFSTDQTFPYAGRLWLRKPD